MFSSEILPNNPTWQYISEQNGDYLGRQLVGMFTNKRIFYARFKAEPTELLHEVLFDTRPGVPQLHVRFDIDELVGYRRIDLQFEEGSGNRWLTLHKNTPIFVHDHQGLSSLIIWGKEFPSFGHAVSAINTRDFSSEYDTLTCWIAIPPQYSPQTLREVLAIPH